MRLLWKDRQEGRLPRQSILTTLQSACFPRGTMFKRTRLELGRSREYEWGKNGNPEDGAEAAGAAVR